MASLLHPYPPTTFRRHPLRQSPKSFAYAALSGGLLALVIKTAKLGPLPTIFFAFASIFVFVVAVMFALRESQFTLSITRDRLIINEGFPFNRRHFIERIYVGQWSSHQNLFEWLLDCGTLTITVGDKIFTFPGLTSYRQLLRTLEES
ncbi:MAG: PH domain-containing protein [Chloroflexus sp.]|uniref:PH domain-containing protein n=1 Tax=Chloroflexus sp. TaxID=1904827 RepID=UPI004049B30D